MKPKTLTLLILTAIVMASVACSSTPAVPTPAQPEPTPIPAQPEPTPNLDATIEANVIEVIKAQPTLTPYPTPSPVPTSTSIPTPMPSPTPQPTPVPTSTSVPTPVPTPTPVPDTYLDAQILDSNLLLTLANSPYSIRGNIQVPEGIAVIIEPGVVIRGDNHSGVDKFTILGELRAEGTENEPITFEEIAITTPETTASIVSVTLSHSNLDAVYLDLSLHSMAQTQLSITDSILDRQSQIRARTVTIKRSVIEPFTEPGNPMVMIDTRNIELVNNCFPSRGLRLTDNMYGSLFNNSIIKHNTFDASAHLAYPFFETTKYNKESLNILLTDNYWSHLGDKSIDGFVRDSRNDMTLKARFITEPMLTQPHPDTPPCSSSPN